MPDTLSESSTSRFVQTKEWNIHYNEAGEGDRHVVLLHGSGPGATGWSNFKQNLGALADAGLHVYAVDMPGWGKSDTCPPDRLDHVEAAVQLLDALGIEKAAFVGNSMGGITTLRLAVEHPDRISHIITMGPGSGPGSPKLFSAQDGPSEGMKVLVQAYREPTAENMKKIVEVMTFDDRFVTDELAQERAANALAYPEHLENYLAATAKFGGIIRTWFSLADLAKVEIPALLIHGRDDRVVSYEHSMQLVATLKNSRMVLLARCGHWAQVEHAEPFNRMVAEFVTA